MNSLFIKILLVLTQAASADVDTGICKNCNVILVSIDSLRADHLSTYGYKRKTSPNLDAFAAESTVFDHFFSSAGFTPISEASIHTGKYPVRNGMLNFRKSIDPKTPMLAEILKQNGYETSAFGDSPEFSFPALKESFSRGFNNYVIEEQRLITSEQNSNWKKPLLSVLKKQNKPFFLWWTIGLVHAPFGHHMTNIFADEKYIGPFGILRTGVILGNLQRYYDGFLYPHTKENNFAFSSDIGPKQVAGKMMLEYTNDHLKKPQKISPRDIQFVVDLYDNGIYATDVRLGVLFDELKKSGHDKDTVVIIQSEHGEDLNEHKYIAHYDTWETTTKVPLIWYSPVLKKNSRVKELISGVDVMPGLLVHLGLSIPSGLDGIAFWDKNKVKKIRDEIYLTRSPLWESVLRIEGRDSLFDQFRKEDDQINYREYSIRNENYKLIHRRARFAEARYSCWKYISGKDVLRAEYELYDLKKDPKEQHPLQSLESVFPDMQKKLLDFEGQMDKQQVKTSTTERFHDYR